MKPRHFLTLSLCTALFLPELQAEPSNGLFGFNRNSEQISNALFPGGTETGTGPVTSSTPQPEQKRDSDTIFRGGKPKKVESAAYVIKDGEKIDQPMPGASKPSFFTKLRKTEDSDPLLAATNASAPEEKPEKKPGGFFGPRSNGKRDEEAPAIAETEAPVLAEMESPVAAEPIAVAEPSPPTEVEKEKTGFRLGPISIGRRNVEEEAPVIAPTVSQPAEPVEIAEPVGIPEPAEFAAASSPAPAPAPVAAPAPAAMQASAETEEPAFAATPVVTETEEKRSGGFFSFLSRDKGKDKKSDKPIVTPVPVAEPTAAEADSTVAMARDDGDIPDTPTFAGQPAEPQPVVTTPAPEPVAPAPTAVEDTADDAAPAGPPPTYVTGPVPQQEKEKEKKTFTLTNPIAKRNENSGPVSMEGAETIIANGEIVGEQQDIVEDNIVQTDDGEKRPPRMVDGVKTYDSWDDVEARSVSSADRILGELRRR